MVISIIFINLSNKIAVQIDGGSVSFFVDRDSCVSRTPVDILTELLDTFAFRSYAWFVMFGLVVLHY